MIEPKTLRDRAYSILQQAILSGDLPPGTRLREAGLSRELGVSRGTVREAVVSLAQERLVVIEGHRGTFVRIVTADEIRDIYAARCWLEEFAWRLIAERPRDEIEAPLELSLARFEASSQASFRDLTAADFAFHETIWGLSGNSSLPVIWRSLANPLRAAFVGAGERILLPFQSIEYHHKLVNAALSGDPDSVAAQWRVQASAVMHALLGLSDSPVDIT